MFLVSYDISDNKLRVKFAKFLSKFGHRIQYSLFEIKNSERVLDNIRVKLNNHFEKKFDQNDSVFIFELSNSCKITRYGYAKNEESDVLII